MLIEPSATTAWARALAHHRSIDAAPFSAISSIGIRLEPGIGATSSISVVPKGNASPAAANGGASKRQNSTGKARQQHTIIGTPRLRLDAHEGWSARVSVGHSNSLLLSETSAWVSAF